jgi:hypothetical protein
MKYFKGNFMSVATALFSGLAAPLAGVIIAGSLIPWVHGKGMIVGLCSGLFIFVWINIGQFIHYPHRSYLETNVDNCTFGVNETARPIEPDNEDMFWLYKLSFLYVPLASLLTTIIVGLIASLIFGKQDPKELDPKLMVNLGQRCGCCCSTSCKQKCTCGVPYDELDAEYEKKEEIDLVDTNEWLPPNIIGYDEMNEAQNGTVLNKQHVKDKIQINLKNDGLQADEEFTQF